MNDELEIFLVSDEPLLAKYLKGIRTARTLIFLLASICLLIALFALALGLNLGFNSDSKTVIFPFCAIGLFFLVLGFQSIKRPVMAIVVTLIAFLPFVACELFSMNLFIQLFSEFVYFLFIFEFVFIAVLIRGIIYAKKQKRLIAKLMA
jgi:hypothetical protein